MLHFLAFGFLFASSYGGVLSDIPHEATLDWDRSGRIVGGNNATILDAPYTVLLDLHPHRQCVGSIISKTNILTAGHCLVGTSASNWLVHAGSTFSNMGGAILYVKRYVIHYNYKESNMDSDIAVMFLKTEVPLDGSRMTTIALPPKGFDIQVGKMTLVTGWGSAFEGAPVSRYIEKMSVPIIDQSDCVNAYGSTLITPRMICAGYMKTKGPAPCYGDYGGPLAANGTQFGITSWSFGCGRLGYPGVYTRVSYFLDWIEEQLLQN